MFKPDDAAKAFRDLCMDRLVNAVLPRNVFNGAEPLGVIGSQSLMVRSLAHVNSFWSLVQAMPLTIFSCAVLCQTSSFVVRSQTLITL